MRRAQTADRARLRHPRQAEGGPTALLARVKSEIARWSPTIKAPGR